MSCPPGISHAPTEGKGRGGGEEMGQAGGRGGGVCLHGLLQYRAHARAKSEIKAFKRNTKEAFVGLCYRVLSSL